MDLAKPAIDVGLFTHNPTPMLAFWQRDVGLPFEELLPIGGGVHQHRHAMNGSVLKLNAAREPLEPAPASGYRELIIARSGIEAPRSIVDPDGNRITLVPEAHDDVSQIAVRLAVRDAPAFDRFYGRALGLEAAGERRYRCGRSLLTFDEDAAAVEAGRMQAPGFRYITIQVRDVDAEHAGIIARGGAEGRPPITLGATARISFVRDPDGNWIEISQRASLTGPLPER
jgi:lactoylglutathione lyase